MNASTIILPDGVTYVYLDVHPSSSPSAKKPTLVCLHGFPDQWYGWTAQITAWSRAGFRIIMPHMLGYGSTSKPSKATRYSSKSICADIAALLDHLRLDKAVVVGHDWGAAVAWRFGLYYPQRLVALITMSVPYFPPSSQYRPPQQVSKLVPSFAYQEYFASTEATREIEANLDIFLRAIFQSSKNNGGDEPIPILEEGKMRTLIMEQKSIPKTRLVISEKQLERYRKDLQAGGMNGPLSYYRNSFTRFEDEKGKGLKLPSIPILFLYGTSDETCPSSYVQRMSALSNVKIVSLEGAGHWVLYEEGERVVKEVLDFLKSIEPENAPNARL